MKVSERSWHFRWLKRLKWDRPYNLCAYFWTVVWSILAVPIAMAGTIIGLGFITMPLWWWLMENSQQLLVPATILAAFEIGFLGVAWFEVRKTNYIAEHGYVPKPDSLTKAWLKAKKEKVCPLIEYVE